MKAWNQNAGKENYTMKELVAGVDGCKDGWVVALAPVGDWKNQDDLKINNGKLKFIKTFNEIFNLQENGKVSIIMIDIPIGLTDGEERECDKIARRLLGDRGSSVFPAPIRPAIEDESTMKSTKEAYEKAKRITLKNKGKSVSQQSWRISPKVKQVDEEMKKDKALQNRVMETHPELCFWGMNKKRPMKYSKTKEKEKARKERINLLKKIFSGIEKIIEDSPKAIQNDIIDAYACLWTAIQYKRGRAYSLPGHPPVDSVDSQKLKMEIWYPLESNS
jgi:predicted RNase H-like nuclease